MSTDRAAFLRVLRRDAATIALCGDVDLAAAGALAEALADARVTAVDAAGVTFADAAGLSVLLRASRERRLTLVAPSRALRRLVELAGVADAFDLCP